MLTHESNGSFYRIAFKNTDIFKISKLEVNHIPMCVNWHILHLVAYKILSLYFNIFITSWNQRLVYFMFGDISVYDEIPERNCQAFEGCITPAEGRGGLSAGGGATHLFNFTVLYPCSCICRFTGLNAHDGGL